MRGIQYFRDILFSFFDISWMLLHEFSGDDVEL